MNKKKIKATQIFSVAGLPIFIVVVFAFFSILKPDTFPTAFNIRSIFNNQAVNILLALAVMVPIITGYYDMSVGYSVCLYHLLMIGLITRKGLPWGVVALIIIAIGLLVGLVNGLLITKLHIDGFIATLGTGMVLYGIAFWYCDGAQIVGDLPASFLLLNKAICGVPVPFIIALIIGVILFIIFDYTPFGRYMYFVGANKKAAQLSGINVNKYLIISFMGSGLLTAIASILLLSIIRVGQISIGQNYLLPAFAGALMGATSFRPGKQNVWGTVCAVLLLAFAFSGLKQLGAAYYVEPLFNGIILIVAVFLSTYTQSKKATKN